VPDPCSHPGGTAGEAWYCVSGAYLDYARYYLSAPDGTLASEADPEFW
jgi:hypothetical protein